MPTGYYRMDTSQRLIMMQTQQHRPKGEQRTVRGVIDQRGIGAKEGALPNRVVSFELKFTRSTEIVWRRQRSEESMQHSQNCC